MPLRVLVIAEACNPLWTSVPLVGYNMARALALRPDYRVTLATHVRNRPELEADPLARRADLHFIDNEYLARPLHRLGLLMRGGASLSWTIETALAWPSYMLFEAELFHHFRREFRDGAFDLIHRVTPLTPTIGGPLAGQVDVPMIVGPLNGGLPWPAEYPNLRRQEREWLVPLRKLYRALPYYRTTYRHLAGVISGSRHTAGEIPTSFKGSRFYLPENGVDPARFPLADDWTPPQGRFRFVTVGRLVPYKGVDLILDAMANSPKLRECELHVVGDGPIRADLEARAKAAGLLGCVRFLGWLPQADLAREVRNSQVFAFPSLREFGGGVVLEAMASCLPSIIVDYGGPAELVNSESGILLPMKPREQLVPLLAAAMESLAGDHVRCRTLGRAAGQRIRAEFLWDVKASRVAEFHRAVLEKRN
jgi:glycosyltransferase involved in cell wall biosynthesis